MASLTYVSFSPLSATQSRTSPVGRNRYLQCSGQAGLTASTRVVITTQYYHAVHGRMRSVKRACADALQGKSVLHLLLQDHYTEVETPIV